ncbi:MAG: DegQ family serine endoprotease [Steroidobacteraceae bacterium]
MSGQWSARRAGILVAASAAAAAFCVSSSARTPLQAAARGGVSAVAELPDFEGLVQKYGPAVVNVQVVERPESSSGSSKNPFRLFPHTPGIPNLTPHDLPPERGTGSGFIVSADGYILTNAHVVADAEQVTVKLVDRREFQAKVIGVDERTDIAVIKINAHGLPVVKIGDARTLKPGQWVVAIGSPFDFENSVTAGIVSALYRSLPSDNYVPFIQTDVPVNPGNSGGPLFNVKGEVVGINSQIFSQTGGFMGLSFAIPINIAVNVEAQLIKTGHVTRGRIGVTIQPVNAELADSFGLDRPRGALVSSVSTGGPAQKAGMKPGDVILAVDGDSIDRYGQVSSSISNMRPGTQARLTIWRDRKPMDVEVRIAKLDEKPAPTAAVAKPEHLSDKAARLGLSVRSLTAAEKKQAQTAGSLIVEQAAGPAASAGVEPGDIILGVDGRQVHSASDLERAAASAGKTLALLIQRQDSQVFVPLRLP